MISWGCPYLGIGGVCLLMLFLCASFCADALPSSAQRGCLAGSLPPFPHYCDFLPLNLVLHPVIVQVHSYPLSLILGVIAALLTISYRSADLRGRRRWPPSPKDGKEVEENEAKNFSAESLKCCQAHPWVYICLEHYFEAQV